MAENGEKVPYEKKETGKNGKITRNYEKVPGKNEEMNERIVLENIGRGSAGNPLSLTP